MRVRYAGSPDWILTSHVAESSCLQNIQSSVVTSPESVTILLNIVSCNCTMRCRIQLHQNGPQDLLSRVYIRPLQAAPFFKSSVAGLLTLSLRQH